MSIQAGMAILTSFVTCHRCGLFFPHPEEMAAILLPAMSGSSDRIFRVMLDQKVSFIPTIWPKFSTTLDLWKN